MKNFADLTEREVLAVAISAEEEDSRIYMTFAEDLAERYPESAKIFEEMAEEEKGHRHMLLEMYEKRFGSNLPPIRRENVKGFLRRRPIWLTKNLSLDAIRKEVGTMEFEAERFYVKAAEQTQDVGVRRLLGDLAEAEKGHEKTAAKLLAEAVRATNDTVIVAPDLGAVKLAERYAVVLDLPVAIVRKTRVSGETVRATDVVGDVRGRQPLIVDDMITTAGTVEAAAQALLERGCRPEIVVAATHGLFVGPAALRLAALPLRNVVVTDSLPAVTDFGVPVAVVGIQGALADAILASYRS